MAMQDEKPVWFAPLSLRCGATESAMRFPRTRRTDTRIEAERTGEVCCRSKLCFRTVACSCCVCVLVSSEWNQVVERQQTSGLSLFLWFINCSSLMESPQANVVAIEERVGMRSRAGSMLEYR